MFFEEGGNDIILGGQNNFELFVVGIFIFLIKYGK